MKQRRIQVLRPLQNIVILPVELLDGKKLNKKHISIQKVVNTIEKFVGKKRSSLFAVYP